MHFFGHPKTLSEGVRMGFNDFDSAKRKNGRYVIVVAPCRFNISMCRVSLTNESKEGSLSMSQYISSIVIEHSAQFRFCFDDTKILDSRISLQAFQTTEKKYVDKCLFFRSPVTNQLKSLP